MTTLQIIGIIIAYFVIGFVCALAWRMISPHDEADFVMLFFWPVLLVALPLVALVSLLDVIQNWIEGITK